MQAISLDFLGVPGSAVASKTLELVKQHGFPKEKRLGAGVVDGRSVWSDGGVPAALVASLQKQVCTPQKSTLHCSPAVFKPWQVVDVTEHSKSARAAGSQI